MIGKILVYLFIIAAVLYAAMQFGLIPGALERLQQYIGPKSTTGLTTPSAATKVGAPKSSFPAGTIVLG
jgi:hypothetical protein